MTPHDPTLTARGSLRLGGYTQHTGVFHADRMLRSGSTAASDGTSATGTNIHWSRLISPCNCVISACASARSKTLRAYRSWRWIPPEVVLALGQARPTGEVLRQSPRSKTGRRTAGVDGKDSDLVKHRIGRVTAEGEGSGASPDRNLECANHGPPLLLSAPRSELIGSRRCCGTHG